MEFPNFKGGSSSSFDITNSVQVQTSFLAKMLLMFMLFINGELLPNKNLTTFILDFEYDLSADKTSDFIANHPFLFVLIDRYTSVVRFLVRFSNF
jgi:membrane protein DedA with SNARE-associated domain